MSKINKIRVNNTDYDIESLDIYSTTETMIGTWIDGKPLYRKVVQFNSGSSSGSTIGSLSTDVSPNIDKIISYDGNYYVSGGYSTIKINLFFSENENNYIYITSSGDIKEHHSNSVYNDVPLILILEYTKTTDTANI